MRIEWTQVTWYSQIFAVFVLVTAFLLGIRLGQFKARVNERVDLMIKISNGWVEEPTASAATHSSEL